MGFYWVVFSEPRMELHGRDLESDPNPQCFGYPNPKIRGRKCGSESNTQKPKTRGYPLRTRSAAIPICHPLLDLRVGFSRIGSAHVLGRGRRKEWERERVGPICHARKKKKGLQIGGLLLKSNANSKPHKVGSQLLLTKVGAWSRDYCSLE